MSIPWLPDLGLSILSLFALPAQAGGAAPSALGQLIPVIFIVVIFYILLFLPMRKQRKREAEMRASLGKGDKVVTSGGIYAEIVSVDNDTVIVKVADNVKLRLMKSAVIGKQGEDLTGSTQK